MQLRNLKRVLLHALKIISRDYENFEPCVELQYNFLEHIDVRPIKER